MLAKTEDIIKELKKGKMVLIVDDESRENEGDFIMAASKVTPEDINFMMKHEKLRIAFKNTFEDTKIMLERPHNNLKTNSKGPSDGVSLGQTCKGVYVA